MATPYRNPDGSIRALPYGTGGQRHLDNEPPDLRPRSGLAIAAFVTVFVFMPPVTLLLGILAYRDCIRRDRKGKLLATIAVASGGFFVFFGLLALLGVG